MSNPTSQTRIDGHTLLRWCGFAALAGLFVGVGIGVTILAR
jgi:hypothetical protein